MQVEACTQVTFRAIFDVISNRECNLAAISGPPVKSPSFRTCWDSELTNR